MIGITIGDPKGIGPEIVAKAWRRFDDAERASTLIYGDKNVIEEACKLVGTSFDLKHIVITSSIPRPVKDVSDTEAARMALSAIDAAAKDATSGKIAAIVTAPVNKGRIRKVCQNFTGHTEYLADIAGVKTPMMMFISEETMSSKPIRVALVTTHLSVRDVPSAITPERVLTTIRQTHLALSSLFACPKPRIAVMSLNPHCGEDGALGTEEIEVIAPAVTCAHKERINCIGPISADKIFGRIEDYDYDAVVAMYHDQGIIPMRLLCRNECVNMTLGLPYIRTSPPHGTAEDIAWLGVADETGMLAAIRMARRLVG